MNWDTSKFDQTALSRRPELATHAEFDYRVERSMSLAPQPVSNCPGVEFMRSRRTHRDFGPIDIAEIGRFLYLAMSATGHLDGAYGPVQLRPSISAGARHPIDILVVDPKANLCAVYRPDRHTFDAIQSAPVDIQSLVQQTQKLVPWDQGVLIWLVGQPGRTMAKYEHAESFVYFDAGALAATLSFMAHALNLSYCPLGFSGEPAISRLLHSQGVAIGLLGGVLGTRSGK